MAVGVATRNATVTICDFIERRISAPSATGAKSPSSSLPTAVKDLLSSLSSGQGEQLLSALLTKSVRAAVTSYMDATRGTSTSGILDGVLGSIAKPQNRDALTDLVGRIAAALCRELSASCRTASAASASASVWSPTACGSPSAASVVRLGSGSSGGGSDRGGGGGCVAAARHASFVRSLCGGGGGPGRGSSGQLRDGSCSGAAACAGGGAACEVSPPPFACLGCRQGGGPAWPSSSALLPAGAMHLLDGTAAAERPRCGLPWVLQAAALLRVDELRGLALELVCAASREGSRGAVQGLMQGSQYAGGAGAATPSAAAAAGPGCPAVLQSAYGSSAPYRLCVLAALAVSLCTYALSPRAALLL